MHDDVIQLLTRLLGRAAFDAGLDLRVQSTMTIGGSEPEPDLAVVRRQRAFATHPGTAELVVEVAVTAHRLDRGAKAILYAQAGVPEYWIIDVPGRALERLTEPVAGRYTHSERHDADATIASAAIPAARVVIGELLPAGAPSS